MRYLRVALACTLLVGTASAVSAQQAVAVGQCATPDSIAFRGQKQTSDDVLRSGVGITPKSAITGRSITKAIKDLYATNLFDDVRVTCEFVSGKALLVFHLRERPILSDIKVEGPDKVSLSSVKDRIDLLIDKPVDPAQVAKAVARIDSLYQSHGYYLARVKVDTIVAGATVGLVIRITEGRRLAVSGGASVGNRALSDNKIVSVLSTKPEGFFWWRNGEFDQEKYTEDLSKTIPKLYGAHGYIDMQVVNDTLIIDRNLGKALVRLTVNEGKQYKVGDFEVNGAKVFSSDDIARMYPFSGEKPKSVGKSVKGLISRGPEPGKDVFDQSAWEDATSKVQEAYENQGYIYATIRPVVERRKIGRDSTPTVDLRWDIDERTPAIVNRVDIFGNDVTTETCIRDQLFILPGDVFNRERLINSWRNIANLGFFEQDMPPPDTKPVNEQGDIDIILRVKEKRTGNVNFGASVGQGTGVGGFIGFDQPNLFGQCKRGSLQWQFGRYINDFSLTYTDPRIRETQLTGSITAYHQRSRFIIRDFGASTRTGGQLRLGMPLPRSRLTRAY